MDALPPEIVSIVVRYVIEDEHAARAFMLTCHYMAAIATDVTRRADCERIIATLPALACAPQFVAAFQHLCTRLRTIDVVTGVHVRSYTGIDDEPYWTLNVHIALDKTDAHALALGCNCTVFNIHGPIDCRWFAIPCDHNLIGTCVYDGDITPDTAAQLYALDKLATRVRNNFDNNGTCKHMHIGWSRIRGFMDVGW